MRPVALYRALLLAAGITLAALALAVAVAVAVIGGLGVALMPQFASQLSAFSGSLPGLLSGAGRHAHVFAGLRIPNPARS